MEVFILFLKLFGKGEWEDRYVIDWVLDVLYIPYKSMHLLFVVLSRYQMILLKKSKRIVQSSLF